MNLGLYTLTVYCLCAWVTLAEPQGGATEAQESGVFLGKTFCAIGGADTAAEIWSEHDWQSRYYLTDCTFVWLHLVEDYCVELLGDGMEGNQLTSHQVVNFFQGEDIFIDKGLLPRYLKRYEEKVCNNTRLAACKKKWDVVPELLPIDEIDDVLHLEKRFLEDQELKVILKPSDGAGGSGINVLQHDEFMEFLHSDGVESVMTGEAIMQIYFQSPYLLHKHKSEVALYWTLVSIDPLVVYYFDELQIRRNAEPFDHGQFSPYKHVTNIDAQKSHEHYAELKKSLKWQMKDFKEYIEKDRGNGAFDFLLSQMKRSIVRVLNATVPAMRGEEPYIELPPKLILGYYLEDGCPAWVSESSSVATYRSDFMVDELTLRPVMTEVQSNFGVGYKNSAKKYIIPPLLRGTVDIAHEVARLRSERRPVEEVVNNVFPPHFHILVNEAAGYYNDAVAAAHKRKFQCKSSDGLRCDKYYDPRYHVEITNKFDENTNMFGDVHEHADNGEEDVPILTAEDFEREGEVDLDASMASFISKERVSEEL